METKKMYLVVQDSRDYDEHPKPIACGPSKVALSAWATKRYEEQNDRIHKAQEMHSLYSQMSRANPFLEQPPEPPPKCLVAPRTKEEQQARILLKQAYAEKQNAYAEAHGKHEEKILRKAKEQIKAKYDLPSGWRWDSTWAGHLGLTFSIVDIEYVEPSDG